MYVCGIVKVVCVVCVSLCVPQDLCGDVFVWVGTRYMFDCVLLGWCVDVFVWVGMCLIVYF